MITAYANQLRDRFLDLDYTVDGVLTRIGDAGQAGLSRNQTMPARRTLGSAADPLASLIKIFVLQSALPEEQVRAALPGLTDHLFAAGALERTPSGARALIDIRPYASDESARQWIVADLTPGLDGPPGPIRPDYVLGVSAASTALAQLTIRQPVASALDLGTGCGVQSLHLAGHADRVVATDLNPRALRLASWTAALNGVDIDLRHGDLYQPLTPATGPEKFDLIVTNPPYVIAPPSEDGDRLTYRESDRGADELMREVIITGLDHLTERGTLQVLGNWAHVIGHDWRQRLQQWLPVDGVRAMILERENLDVYEYVEIWLADAGLSGTPGYAAAYRRWLDYFERLGITGIGMGWINLRRTPSQPSVIRIESWPHAVAQPVGAAIADWLAGSRPTDAELYARHWRLAPDVDAETRGRPGAADPEQLIFRQRQGLCRAMSADTALAAVVGTCDGELSLGAIVDAAAQILEQDQHTLRAQLAPRLRQMIDDGFLS